MTDHSWNSISATVHADSPSKRFKMRNQDELKHVTKYNPYTSISGVIVCYTYIFFCVLDISCCMNLDMSMVQFWVIFSAQIIHKDQLPRSEFELNNTFPKNTWIMRYIHVTSDHFYECWFLLTAIIWMKVRNIFFFIICDQKKRGTQHWNNANIN